MFKLERIVWRAGKAMTEVRYGVTNLPAAVADVERLLVMTRAEWGIENGLHYRRPTDSRGDFDQDRYTDVEEYLNRTNPTQ